VFQIKNNANLDALADADLKRLQFVKEHYFNKDENESLYFEALKRIKNEYVNVMLAATINFEIAQIIIKKIQQDEEANTSNSWWFKRGIGNL
jgi:hypothetical protein